MRPRRPTKTNRRRDWPAVVYLWTFGLGLSTYSVARLVLDGKPHPIHWLSGLGGAAAGIAIGWLWFRWRGDVF